MEVTVPTSHTWAADTARRQYNFEGAQYIWRRSWDENDDDSSSSSGGGSGLNLDQTTGLVILGGGLLAFFTLTPFIMSGLLGTAGTWVAGKATNYSLQEYADTNNPSDNESKKALTILVSAVVLGTIGFGWGSNIQKGFSGNSTNTSMIENIRKA